MRELLIKQCLELSEQGSKMLTDCSILNDRVKYDTTMGELRSLTAVLTEEEKTELIEKIKAQEIALLKEWNEESLKNPAGFRVSPTPDALK